MTRIALPGDFLAVRVVCSGTFDGGKTIEEDDETTGRWVQKKY